MTLAACGETGYDSQDEIAIRGVLDAQAQAWNRGDIDGFMAGYHDRVDTVFTSSGNIRNGFEATLAGYRKRYVDGGDKMGTLSFNEVSVRGLGPKAALVYGRWKLTDTPEAGGGVFSLVFEDKNGWKIIHDHTSKRPDEKNRD